MPPLTDDESFLIDEFSVIGQEEVELVAAATEVEVEAEEKEDTTPIPLNRIKGSKPVYLKCPHCAQLTLTVLKHRPGIKSVLSCLSVGLVAWCGCCLVPFWMKSCQDAIHCCGECGQTIAVVERKVMHTVIKK